MRVLFNVKNTINRKVNSIVHNINFRIPKMNKGAFIVYNVSYINAFQRRFTHYIIIICCIIYGYVIRFLFPFYDNTSYFQTRDKCYVQYRKYIFFSEIIFMRRANEITRLGYVCVCVCVTCVVFTLVGGDLIGSRRFRTHDLPGETQIGQRADKCHDFQGGKHISTSRTHLAHI